MWKWSHNFIVFFKKYVQVAHEVIVCIDASTNLFEKYFYFFKLATSILHFAARKIMQAEQQQWTKTVIFTISFEKSSTSPSCFTDFILTLIALH